MTWHAPYCNWLLWRLELAQFHLSTSIFGQYARTQEQTNLHSGTVSRLKWEGMSFAISWSGTYHAWNISYTFWSKIQCNTQTRFWSGRGSETRLISVQSRKWSIVGVHTAPNSIRYSTPSSRNLGATKPQSPYLQLLWREDGDLSTATWLRFLGYCLDGVACWGVFKRVVVLWVEPSRLLLAAGRHYGEWAMIQSPRLIAILRSKWSVYPQLESQRTKAKSALI